MMDYNTYDPFSVCFNILKLKYSVYDEELTKLNFLNPHDRINLFINMESIFNNLSMIMDLEKKIVIQRDFEEIMISNILNIIAHYKRFFVSNGLDTKVFIYNTDLKSKEFTQIKYNEDFRSYYLLKYNNNPKFTLLSDRLKASILPQVKTYCEFIPNVYYISSTDIEGSLIPYIISELDKNRKNLIIGSDFYETQYSLINNFANHHINTGFNQRSVFGDVKSYIKKILKNDEDYSDSFVDIFNNYGMYCTLLSVLGNKGRSIDSIVGYGLKTLYKQLASKIASSSIQETSTNPVVISEIFDEDDEKEEFINNYYCSSVIPMYTELTPGQIATISGQISDRVDVNTLQQLNSTKFYNHPFILEGLLI